MLNPNILNELKMANFKRWGMHFGPPALYELIGACERENPTGEFVLKKVVHDAGDFGWLAFFNEGDGGEYAVGEGKHPDEAVARLWLALHRRKESTERLKESTERLKVRLLAVAAAALKSDERRERRDEPENSGGAYG